MDEAISARGFTCSASATSVKLLLDIPGLDTSVSKIQHVNITVVRQTKKKPSAFQKHSEFGCKTWRLSVNFVYLPYEHKVEFYFSQCTASTEVTLLVNIAGNNVFCSCPGLPEPRKD